MFPRFRWIFNCSCFFARYSFEFFSADKFISPTFYRHELFSFSGQILIFSIYRQTFVPTLLAYMNSDFQCRYYLPHFFSGIFCSQFFGRHWLFLFYSNMLIASTPSGYIKGSYFLRLYYLFRLSRQTLIFWIFWATIKSSHFLQTPEIFNVFIFLPDIDYSHVLNKY